MKCIKVGNFFFSQRATKVPNIVKKVESRLLSGLRKRLLSSHPLQDLVKNGKLLPVQLSYFIRQLVCSVSKKGCHMSKLFYLLQAGPKLH